MKKSSRESNVFKFTVPVISSLAAMVMTVALPDFPVASEGYGGHRRPSPGPSGISIGIQLSPPRQKEVDFDKIERELKGPSPASEDISKEPRKIVEKLPLRKLAKPRVPYLIELAMDIDKTLLELVAAGPEKAVQVCKSAITRAKKSGDTRSETEALTNLANIYYLTGQFTKASENFESALSISSRLDNRLSEAIALRSLAAVSIAGGDYYSADEHNARALNKYTEMGNSRGIRMVLNNQGVLEKNRGLYAPALKAYEKALAVENAQNDFLLLTLTNLGNLANRWGETKSALEYFTRAQDHAKKTNDHKSEAEALLKMGEVYSDSGRTEIALQKSQAALEILTRTGAPTDWAKKIVGDLLMNLGELDKAEPLLKEADYDSSLGLLYLLKSDTKQAGKHYELLMGAGRREGNTEELFTAYTGMGKVSEIAGNYRQAETYYSKGLDVVEEIRSSLLMSERRNFFTAKINGFSRSEPAKGLTRVLLKQKKAGQSIYPGETVRAREFADNLTQNIEASYFEVPAQILAREFQVTNKLASVKTALSIMPREMDPERFSSMSREIKNLESDRNNLVQMLWKDHKAYASVKYPRPVKLEETSLEPDEYVIIFDLLGTGLGTKILKGKKMVDAYFTDWSINELESQIGAFRKSFESADLRRFDPDLALLLYNRLLAGPLERIPKGSSITIVPDGVLALIPFEVLVSSGKAEWKPGRFGDRPEGITFVNDLYPLSYYQSLTAMTLTRTLGKKKKFGERLFVMADPVFATGDLRAESSGQGSGIAREEDSRSIRLMAAIEEESKGHFKLPRLSRTSDMAKNLESLYGSTCDVYTGMQSQKKAFLSKMMENGDTYKSLIFATHGFASNQIPGIMEPVLVLALLPPGTDGYLTMSEVAGLKMNVDMVALTACQTGTGVKLAGEGIMSMGRAFQCAGAKSVIMSLWSVAEDPSVLLMEEYFKLLKTGEDKMTAWRKAKTSLRDAGYDHPFFWGAFVLVGEPH